MNLWRDGENGPTYAIPEDGKPETAARMIREDLLKHRMIGKFSSVTVELMSAGAVNVYREVI